MGVLPVLECGGSGFKWLVLVAQMLKEIYHPKVLSPVKSNILEGRTCLCIRRKVKPIPYWKLKYLLVQQTLLLQQANGEGPPSNRRATAFSNERANKKHIQSLTAQFHYLVYLPDMLIIVPQTAQRKIDMCWEYTLECYDNAAASLRLGDHSCQSGSKWHGP